MGMEKTIKSEGVTITYDPKTAFGNTELLKALRSIEVAQTKRQAVEECDLCDKYGVRKVECENCSGLGELEIDCTHDDEDVY